jgi:hypothetical protein
MRCSCVLGTNFFRVASVGTRTEYVLEIGRSGHLSGGYHRSVPYKDPLLAIIGAPLY